MIARTILIPSEEIGKKHFQEHFIFKSNLLTGDPLDGWMD